MKQKDYEQSQRSLCEIFEIYRKVSQEKFSVKEISRQYGISRSSVYRKIRTFELENPKEAEIMKRESKEVGPEEYRKLQSEVSALKKALAQERLRADFYEEMVAYGKEVYGIDLKKAGTK